MNDDHSPKLVPIGVVSLKEVSANLRRLADDMDSGKCEAASSAVLIMGFGDGTVWCNGFGERTSPLEIMGWLARAQAKITSFPDPSRYPARQDGK